MSIRRHLRLAFYHEVALGLLDAIARARAALQSEGGGKPLGESLHDCRVLVRRLIECTRIWAPKPLRRQVLPLVRPWIRATNEARDREVELAGLAQLDVNLSEPAQVAMQAFAIRCEEAARQAVAEARQFLADPDRGEEEARLRALLAPLAHFAARPRRLPRRLIPRRTGFFTPKAYLKDKPQALHPLRLEAKQLRYGLESLASLDRRVRLVLTELTALQRTLGEYRDGQRLSELLASAGLPAELVRRARQQAEEQLALMPAHLDRTAAFFRGRWAAPPLDLKTLRQRLLKRLEAFPQAPAVHAALELATQSLRGHKRADGSAALTHPLRAALSLLEEGQVREARPLVAALLLAAPAKAARTPEALATHFDPPIVAGLLTLWEAAAEPSAAPERLHGAAAWVLLARLAGQLEELRYLAECGRPGKLRSLASSVSEQWRPLWRRLRSQAAQRLLERLDALLAEINPAPQPDQN